MIEQFNRAMNEAERSLLIEWITETTPIVTARGTIKWTALWLFGICMCVGLLLAGSPLVEQHPIAFGLLAAPIFIAAIVCLCAIALCWSSYFHWSGNDKRFQQVDVPEIKKALQDGMVSVKKVTASAVIELVEFEDEGGGYVFDLGDNQSLFLQGQHIIPVSEEMPWPNSEFDIVRSIIGDLWVGIFCHGKILTPIRTIELSGCREDVVWMSCEDVVEEYSDSFASSLLAE